MSNQREERADNPFPFENLLELRRTAARISDTFLYLLLSTYLLTRLLSAAESAPLRRAKRDRIRAVAR